MAKTPVITSLQPDQLQLFTEFMGTLRVDNTILALDETDKIQPYLNAFAKTLAEDKRTSGIRNADLTELTKPGALSALFNRMAEKTKNTLLSGLLIAPESLLKTAEAKDGITHFGSPVYYNGHSFTFGFLQIFTEGEKSSTSINVLSFNAELMEAIEPFKPTAMLHALQVAATSSNHDMHHHYTSPQISSDIARTMRDSSLPKPTFAFDNWWDKYFSPYRKDSDPYSYESALMLNHARIRRLLEEGPAGKALKNDCDDFFDELAHIGKEMAAATSIEQAHKAVDYFGTMLIFALARGMPLDHPLMDHVISRLKEADPDPALLEKKSTDIIDTINGNIKLTARFPDQLSYERDALSNYKTKGVELMPEKLEEVNYTALKKLQLMMIQPWIIHLMSPPQPDTQLAKMHDRLGKLYLEMMQSSASTAWFNAVDGRRRTKQPDGGTVETYIKNGKLDRNDGPAYIKKDVTGKIVEEQWFKEGQRYREEGGPHFIRMTPHNLRIEKWFNETGHEYRCIEIRVDGSRTEKWLNDKGQPHRTDGPARLDTDAQGNTTREEWQLDGAYHREDGPAHTYNLCNGAHIEIWYRRGLKHRDGAPAWIETDARGNLEGWFKNGKEVKEETISAEKASQKSKKQKITPSCA